MSIFDEKIAAARKVFDDYNASVDENQKFNFETFLKQLKAAGGTTDAALVECAWEDIQNFTDPDKDGAARKLPILTAKQIISIFRKKPTDQKTITDKKALSLTPAELLAHFITDRFNADTPVGRRLLDLSKGSRFLVFHEDNSLNQEASLSCLVDIINGHDAQDVYVGSDGVPYETYPVGHKPDNLAAENPLLPGQALRGQDEACAKTHRKWSSIPHRIRVLLRLALLDSRELVIDHVGRIHDTLDLLVSKSPEEMLAVMNQRYPKAALKYRDLNNSGGLPTLKINKNNPSNKKQDPFFGNR